MRSRSPGQGRWLRRLVVGLAVPALLILWGEAAQAREDEELVERAMAAFSNGEFSRSIQLLNRARAMAKTPKVLGRIYVYLGANHEAMGDTEAAEGDFHTALTHDPEVTLDPGRFKPSLVALLDRVRARARGTLSVAGVAGAEVAIDGKRKGVAPLTIPLPVGPHRLEVRSVDGKILYSDTVVVAADRTSRIMVEIGVGGTPSSPLRYEHRSAEARRDQRGVREREPAQGPGSPRDDASPRTVSWPAWVALGAAIIAGGAGVALGVAAKNNEEQALDLRVPHDKAKEHYDSARSQAMAANFLFVGAGAAAITSGILFYLKYRRQRSRRVTIAPGPAGVVARVTW